MDSHVVVTDGDHQSMITDGGQALATPVHTNSVNISPVWLHGHTDIIQERLLAWYDRCRRQLPWRGDIAPYGAMQAASGASKSGSPPSQSLDGQYRNAYGTWVSEVMLQQTRVETVIPYWTSWMTRWPTVADLAAASEDDVNTAWAGLGFYRRARNLHKGAKMVVEKLGGLMPMDVAGLKSLPGVGDYTAGAIASIAYGLKAPLVDGNVVRVFSRLHGLAEDAKCPRLAKKCWLLAHALVPSVRPGSFNQALMELGATICAPKGPNCQGCPLREADVCVAYSEARTAVISGIVESPAVKKKELSSIGDIEDVILGGASAVKAKKQSTLDFFRVSKGPGWDSADASAPALVGADTISSSGQPLTGGEALNAKQWAAISAYITHKFPLKTIKKESPTERIFAVFLEAPCVNQSVVPDAELLFVRIPGPSAERTANDSMNTCFANPGHVSQDVPASSSALLAGQWAPITVSLGRHMPVRKEGALGSGADDVVDIDINPGAEAAGDEDNSRCSTQVSNKRLGKRKQLTSTGNPPLDCLHVTGVAKRQRQSSGVGLHWNSEAFNTAIASLSASWGAQISFDLNGDASDAEPTFRFTREQCGSFTHVFSHVVHEVLVERWKMADWPGVLDDDAGSEDGKRTANSQRQTLVESMQSAIRSKVGGPSHSIVQSRWARVPDMENLGLTTWTAKALHAVLGAKYSQWQKDNGSMKGEENGQLHTGASSSSYSSSSFSSSTSTSAMGDKESGWPALAARWKKAGCSGIV